MSNKGIASNGHDLMKNVLATIEDDFSNLVIKSAHDAAVWVNYLRRVAAGDAARPDSIYVVIGHEPSEIEPGMRGWQYQQISPSLSQNDETGKLEVVADSMTGQSFVLTNGVLCSRAVYQNAKIDLDEAKKLTLETIKRAAQTELAAKTAYEPAPPSQPVAAPNGKRKGFSKKRASSDGGSDFNLGSLLKRKGETGTTAELDAPDAPSESKTE